MRQPGVHLHAIVWSLRSVTWEEIADLSWRVLWLETSGGNGRNEITGQGSWRPPVPGSRVEQRHESPYPKFRGANQVWGDQGMHSILRFIITHTCHTHTHTSKNNKFRPISSLMNKYWGIFSEQISRCFSYLNPQSECPRQAIQKGGGGGGGKERRWRMVFFQACLTSISYLRYRNSSSSNMLANGTSALDCLPQLLSESV